MQLGEVRLFAAIEWRVSLTDQEDNETPIKADLDGVAPIACSLYVRAPSDSQRGLALLLQPFDVACDASTGAVFVADYNHHEVKIIFPPGFCSCPASFSYC